MWILWSSWTSWSWLLSLYNNGSIDKKTCVKTKTYMFNNPHSTRRILLNNLKWKGLFISWNKNWVHVSCQSSYLLDVPFVQYLSDYWTVGQKNIHMLDIPYVRHPTCAILHRLSRLLNILAYFIVFWFCIKKWKI